MPPRVVEVAIGTARWTGPTATAARAARDAALERLFSNLNFAPRFIAGDTIDTSAHVWLDPVDGRWRWSFLSLPDAKGQTTHRAATGGFEHAGPCEDNARAAMAQSHYRHEAPLAGLRFVAHQPRLCSEYIRWAAWQQAVHRAVLRGLSMEAARAEADHRDGPTATIELVLQRDAAAASGAET